MEEAKKYFKQRLQTMEGEPLEEIRKVDLEIIYSWMEDYAADKIKDISPILWKAAKETVTLHHYNGDTRPPIDVDKYKTLQDYLNGNARVGN